MTTIDNVTEMLRIPFKDGYDIELNEFFNYITYLIHKNNKLKQELKK